MRIGRSVIFAAALALGLAGSLLSGSAIAATAGHATTAHVQVVSAATSPNMLYHG
jgi:hypothetical protein